VGGQYVLRTDGVILAPDSATWIIDGQTTSPVTRMTNVSSGISHGCSSDDSGSAWCWQTDKTGNSAGQLGNGTNVDSGLLNRATKVLKAANSPLTGVVGLADYCIDHYSGFDASCAVTGQGQLHCWGNLSWIVNGGVLLTSSYAEAITMDGLNPLTGVLQASIGEGRSACVVVQGTPSNTVYCWGHNGSYNLGQGDTTNRQYPTKVNGLSAPTKVVIAADDNGGVGSTTTCAIDGGQVLCWGYNGSLGDCGVNTTVATVTIPTRVKIQSGAVLDNIVDLEGEGDPGYGNGGGGNFCALRSDGSMWCWGRFYKPYAANYGITNITAVGNVFDTPRYLTSDGIYHVGSGKTEALNCGTLQ
jgi:alpha-tubulin suppressor-like RCC1 family protein